MSALLPPHLRSPRYMTLTVMARARGLARPDYVRAPKPNGYRSLHATIVPTSSRLPRFEIQVRTRAMDDVALHGSAAHRAYKLAAASPRVAGVV